MNADVESFLSTLAEAPDAWLQCRTMQHSWSENGPFRVVDITRERDRGMRGGQALYAERRLLCVRCGMQRSDAFQMTSASGHTALRKISASYTPPEGYYIKGGGMLSRDLVLGAKFDRDIRPAAVPHDNAV